MITKCIGRDFKGLTFEQPLGRLNLLVGPNGSGKSVRTQALILAIMGYIPGGAKKNAEILGAYGTEDSMVVGFEADVLFERAFVRSGEAVSQGHKIAGGRVKEGEFQKSLGLHGNPKIVDISAFMELSNQKKIDAVFSLYPPAGDVNKIQGEIDSTKEKINGLVQKAKTSEAAAARLVAAKPPLPAGTLADVTGKIAETTESLRVARKEMVDAQVAEGARLAKEKAEKKAEEQKKIDDAKQKVIDDAKHAQELEATRIKAARELEAVRLQAAEELEVVRKEAKEKARKEAEDLIKKMKPVYIDTLNASVEDAITKTIGKTSTDLMMDTRLMENPLVTDAQVAAFLAEKPGEMAKECDRLLGKYPTAEDRLFGQYRISPAGWVYPGNVAQSIQTILDALRAAGCESCAARLVAVREMKKYKGAS